MDMLLAMRTVSAIADLGSFTRAAERLGLSRAMTSKHVADLEQHLGIRIFNRSTRRLHLTDAGADLLETVRQVIELVDQTERTASDRAREPTGLLRISAPMSFGVAHLAPLVVPYLDANRAASIELSLNDRFVDLIEEGYDLAIRIGTLPDSSLIATRLAQSRLHLVAAPAYIARHGQPADISEIHEHRCLDYAQAAVRQGWTFEQPGRRTITPLLAGTVRCNNGDALVRMACDGGGIAYQPDFIIAEHVRSGALKIVLPGIATRKLGIYAIHPAGRHVPLKTRAFIDHLRRAYAGTPPWALPAGLPGKSATRAGPASSAPVRTSRAPRKASRSL